MDILQTQNSQSKRLRFMLAKLLGSSLDIDLRGFMMQASAEEFQAWLEIQQCFVATKGDDEQLKALEKEARLEYQQENAFEQGRKYAFSLPANEVAEHGLQWRESKNPYLHDDIMPTAVKEAWTAGFQSALEVIAGESW